MMRPSNKKAEIFLPGLVIITIIVFTTLAITILNNNSERKTEPPIGAQAVSLIKIQQESNKINFYIENSAKFSQQEALKILAENGGYPKNNPCEKTKKTAFEQSLIYLNKKCGPFDPENSFINQFNLSLQNYLDEFQSNYINTEKDTGFINIIKGMFTGNFDISEGKFIRTHSTGQVKIMEPSELKLKQYSFEITFPAKRFPIEFSTINSYFEFQPRFTLSPVNLNNFDNLYSALSKCMPKPENCEAEIIAEFPEAEIETQGEYLKINTKTDPEIRLLFNPKSDLPEYQTTVLK